MSWGARIRAAIQGDVDGADVRALLAASAPLASLRRQLADRRLEAELAHVGEEWRAAADLGEIAAPLWLADSLVSLAGSLADADAAARPNMPGAMTFVAHRQALALLQPVGTIIAEVSASLADPGHHSALTLPIGVGRLGLATDQVVPSLPPSYLRGLLQGAERLEGSAQVALEDLATLVGRSATPPWIAAGIQRLRGELAGAQSRLEMIRTRSASLLNQQSLDEAALRGLDADLWPVVDTYLRAGQLATAPRLLPGAPTVSPALPVQTPVQQTPPTTAPPAAAPGSPPIPPRQAVPPPTPPAVEKPRAIPDIGPSWQAPAGRKAEPQSPPGTPEETPRSLPQIGAPGPSTQPRERAHDLPEIGAAGPPPTSRPAARELPHIAPPTSTSGGEARAMPNIAALAQPATPATRHAGRHVERAERWLLSSTGARHRLRANGAEDQAERALAAFWQARDWTLSPPDQEYLAEVAALVSSGAVNAGGRSLNEPPFAPIYRVAGKEVALLGQRLAAGHLFAFDYRNGRLLNLEPQDGVPD